MGWPYSKMNTKKLFWGKQMNNVNGIPRLYDFCTSEEWLSGKEERKQEVIKWMNDTFVPCGMPIITELELGVQQNETWCTIGNTLNTYLWAWIPANHPFNYIASVGDRSWSVSVGGIESPFYFKHFEIPEFMEHFIHDFDSGGYPELVDEVEDEIG